MNIALVYFSPTGSTAKIASIVKKILTELGNQITEFDITNYSEREKPHYFDQFEAFVFGFPVYYWRAPRLIREWIQTLEGKIEDVQCSSRMEESVLELPVKI